MGALCPNQQYQGIHHSAWNSCISRCSRKTSPSTRSMQSTSSATYKMPLHCLKSLKKHCTILAATRPWYQVKFQACQHFSWPTVRRKEGVNGVNWIATKGEKYYWLPTKREKKLPTTDTKIINRLPTWTDIIYIFMILQKKEHLVFFLRFWEVT